MSKLAVTLEFLSRLVRGMHTEDVNADKEYLTKLERGKERWRILGDVVIS